MSGIYIHIPFCKQACHYCDFHFSTSLKKREEMVMALQKEVVLRKNEFSETLVETIYFGGGTPSLLTTAEINSILETIYANYKIASNPEITLEANPDDLNKERITAIAASKINRLSIGIQSFFETDLKLMNRAHNAEEAKQSITYAKQYFDNISIDLIYGIPGMSNAQWEANLQEVLRYNIPHISSYALTVEPKTALKKYIDEGKIAAVKDEVSRAHYDILVATLSAEGFVNYEFSNFGKEGYFSRNNTAYWEGKSYLGIGPSAHSFNGKERSWNINNNSKYLKAILKEDRLPSEVEKLTVADCYNEYVMTGLRTQKGISLAVITSRFGLDYSVYIKKHAARHLKEETLLLENRIIKATQKGKFLTDGIASDLFFLN